MCQHRIYNSFIIVQSDNARSSIPQKLTTCTKNTSVFSSNARLFLRFYAEIRENRFTNGHFHGNINIFRPGFYWTDFVNWADKNVPNLLEEELKKQGLNAR